MGLDLEALIIKHRKSSENCFDLNDFLDDMINKLISQVPCLTGKNDALLANSLLSFQFHFISE